MQVAGRNLPESTTNLHMVFAVKRFRPVRNGEVDRCFGQDLKE
jgi:hypothetical protein